MGNMGRESGILRSGIGMDWETNAFETSTSWQRRGHFVGSGHWGAPSLNGTKNCTMASEGA